MAKGEEIGSGVVNVFESIASGVKDKDEREKKSPRRKTAKIKALTKAVDQYKKTAEKDDRPKARIGRFPGTRNGPEKERISGRITPDLKDAYVEWALSDRCALGELMERALIEFYQRHRTSGS